MKPTAAEIERELREAAEAAELRPMPDGLTDAEQLDHLESLVAERRREMGIES